jgi:FkbH-like protein
VASKNDEAIALEAIDRHPEMVLKRDDLAGWKINWLDKAQNIADLVSSLNLGLDSVVFIDNDPAERDRVREALPEVYVPDWPEDAMLYKSALLKLRCFDSPSLSHEDAERTVMYASERGRQDLKRKIGSVDEWLKGLMIKVTVEELNGAILMRASQLLNKTYLMNLATRRLTESELAEWAGRAGHKLWTFRVSDKFGDYGLTGIVSLEIDGSVGRIADFILSCRVIGRKVEEAMLNTVVSYGRSAGLEEVLARYIPTAKNSPCLDFFRRSGFAYDGKKDIFIWRLKERYALPAFINVDGGGAL